MATWAIGDVHGCYRTLRDLVARPEIGASDRICFVGDLVNRGPRSLETLRFVADLGDRATAVLGNHDLHFLAVAVGARERRGGDTLGPLLEAPDRGQLVSFLLGRPLLTIEGGDLFVHAGLLAGWTPGDAEKRARAAEMALRDATASASYLKSYRPRKSGSPGRSGLDAEVLETLRVMTLLRIVSEQGAPCYDFTGTLAELPPGRVPWFDAPARRSASVRIVCGHWAALGLYVRGDLVALDSGCAWGNALSAFRLEDGRVLQVENLDR